MNYIDTKQLTSFQTKKDLKYCIIHYVETKEKKDKNKGYAKQNLKNLIEKMKNKNISEIFLYVCYDISCYDNPDLYNGLERLVNLYSSIGFETNDIISSNEDQIDMKYKIRGD